jgi:hypothetical protein
MVRFVDGKGWNAGNGEGCTSFLLEIQLYRIEYRGVDV